VNREKQFKTALQLAPRERPQSLRRIADRLIDAAETGDLPSIRELVDRLEGKAPMTIDRTDLLIAAELSDSELYLIAAGGEPPMKVIPPMPPKD
jgi:hypothetical protein